ncbi:T9SS type A sorting domain-containing protein [Aridibaculum aurantiacum]|uniref:T9SS type A sorting domain-containing protein n=1 Tax=Aridibaculum aurantiacum TaxID=2810307 RepID=UPI001A96B59F|nr:T9SS type A sorting domain-containing protein [Aridibaculum aurantiacum]
MRKLYLLLGSMLFLNFTYAQLSGSQMVPSASYPTIASAVADVNVQGVGPGGVIFNIAPGYTETITATLSLTATGTAANPITFRRDPAGSGANPVVTAYTTGTATPGTTSAALDGIWRLAGSDYVTIDGIDLQENSANTTAATMMEYGFGLLKASATDGCQYVTIRNCTITLNRNNVTSGTAESTDGSVGIWVANTVATNNVTVTVTSAAGTNSNNRFYNNTIQNCYTGIYLRGFAAASPFSLYDTNNDVGGTAAATGNIIRNYGGGTSGTAVAYAIRTIYQANFNLSFNTINNNDGSGVNHPATLRGIFTSTATSVSGTINNNTVSLSGAGTTQAVVAIENGSGGTAAGNTISISNNIVQNITQSAATTGTFTGIANTVSAATVNINGNTVSGVSQSGTGTVIGIQNSGSPTNLTINNNTISNIQKTGASGTIYGISVGTSIAVVSGNMINGLGFNNTSGTSSATLYGIYSLTSPTGETFTGNTIYDLNIVGASTSTSHVLGGIITNSVSSSVKNISQNNIYNLNINSTGGSGTVTGINTSTGNTILIARNKIGELTAFGSSSSARGITVNSGTTLNVQNNLVGNLYTPSASSADAIRGINLASTSATTIINVHYNTVRLDASSSGANFGTSALYATTSTTATTATLNMVNNILVNLSTPSGTGVSAAYRRSSTSLTNYGSASNNNMFYAGTPSATNVIFFDGTNSDQTLDAYKQRVAPRDQNSVTENPIFSSLMVADANYLHLDPTVPTRAESGGTPISGITVDYDGQTRNTTTPDIGADEFNGIAIDETAPVITYNNLVSNCETGNKLLAATITDASGVPTSGSLVPRVYYRKGTTGAWYSQPGTLVGGSATNGTWNFTIQPSDFGGLVTGDIVQYYVIAQDVVTPTPNISSNPAGVVATDVNTVSTHPATLNSYTVGVTLNGNYTIGSSGNYPTIGDAVNAYHTACITGNVTFTLMDGAYSSETFPIVIRSNPDASATKTITFKPEAGMATTISGSSAGAIIRLLGADYVVFDGVNTGGSSLTIANTNTGTSSSLIYLSPASATDGATNNIIRNVTLTGNTPTTTYAAIVSSSSTTLGGVAEAANSNNIFENNTITALQYGIVLVGPTGNEVNNVIRGNTIGSAIAASKIQLNGIAIFQQQNVEISGNNISGVSSAATTPAASGLRIAGTMSGGNIFNNKISDIKNTVSGGWGANGIQLNASTTASNLTIYNNFIWDVAGVGYASGVGLNDNGYGIIAVTGGGYNLYFNSINLNTDQTTGTSAAINITSGITTANSLNIRNNIFANTQTANTRYAIYNAAATTVFNDINNNDYFTTGTNIGYSGSAAVADIAAWRTATGKDAASVSVDPQFISPTDLHLQTSSPLINAGVTIAGITKDIDMEDRDATPDMGADEIVTTLPVTLSDIRAFQHNAGVQVEWKIATETDVKHYEVERSVDGRSFTKAGTVAARGAATYNWLDAMPFQGNNYYRVRVVNNNGSSQLTSVVRVSISKGAAAIVAYPNPVKGESFNLALDNMTAGNYTIVLTNLNGQRVYTEIFSHSGGSANRSVRLPNGLSKGTYLLQVVGENKQFVQKIVKD